MAAATSILDRPERNVSKIRDMIRVSRQSAGWLRKERRSLLESYVGKHYGGDMDGAPDKLPVPLLNMAVTIYLRHLIPRCPRVLVTTDVPSYRQAALMLEMDVNHVLTEIHAATVFEEIVRDAMFGIGFYKQGMAAVTEADPNAEGQPFVDRVGLDDMAWDTSATSWRTIRWVGNRYRVPVRAFQESDLFENKDKAVSSPRSAQDDEGEERAEKLSRGESLEGDESDPHLTLWDIYFPGSNRIITIDGKEGEHTFRSVEWDGPEAGPYGMLSLHPVPDQIIPIPPAMLWQDLHKLANALFRKLGRQAERQKFNTGYRGAAAGDAERLKEAQDGEMIRMEDPEGIKEFSTGGISQQNLAFFLGIQNLFSWTAGNLDSLGGLSPQSETVGQDKLLGEASSKTVEDLQLRVQDFTRQVMRDLAWFRWNDEAAHREMSLPIAEGLASLPLVFSSEAREGDLLDYVVDIEPYSMQYRSPAARLALIRQVWAQDIVPLVPLLQAQGITPNMEEYLRLIARYGDMPEMEQLVMFNTPGQMEQILSQGGGGGGGGGDRPLQAATTRRENVRINRSAGTREGTNKVLANTLLGGASQPAEQAAAVNFQR